MPVNLNGRVAIVTGAGRGIGQAIAQELGEAGATVVALDLDRAAALDVAHKLPRPARGLALDVTSSSDVDRVFAHVADEFGSIDILVNNAGVPVVGPLIVDTTDEQWDLAIGVMQSGVFYCMRAAARYMLEQRRGAIVNISSVRGQTSNPGRVAYCAAKAAVLMMTKVAAGEWGPYGVRANTICPGWQRTPMTEHDLANGVITEADILSAVPLGRLGEPREIARLTAFLCSDDASYISGAEVTIDGGMITIPSDGAIPRPGPVS